FFFQAEDGIRDRTVTGVQTCALPILDFLNQRWLEYTGISSERGLGWAWAEELHPEDREGFVNAWRSAVATGEPFEHDVRVRRAEIGRAACRARGEGCAGAEATQQKDD